MKDLQLTEDGDLAMTPADVLLVYDLDDLKQSIELILSTRLGEFTLDEDLGVLWDNLLGKEYNADYLEQDITDAILEQENRIAQVTEVVQAVENRHLLVTVKMITKTEEELETEVVLDAE